jgi:hypothetical protein
MRKRGEKKRKKKRDKVITSAQKELLQQSNCLHLLNRKKRNAKIPSHET